MTLVHSSVLYNEDFLYIITKIREEFQYPLFPYPKMKGVSRVYPMAVYLVSLLRL